MCNICKYITVHLNIVCVLTHQTTKKKYFNDIYHTVYVTMYIFIIKISSVSGSFRYRAEVYNQRKSVKYCKKSEKKWITEKENLLLIWMKRKHI